MGFDGKKAEFYYMRKKYDLLYKYAEEYWESDTDAQAWYGWCKASGRGCKQDMLIGDTDILLAATNNSLYGSYFWSFVLHGGFDEPEDISAAKRELERAAYGGLALAQLDLGRNYYWGFDDYPEDKELGVQWIKKAADQECAEAENEMYVCYTVGKGIAYDPDMADLYYKRAALHGYPYAEHAYASECLKKNDYENAAFWAKRALDGGISKAQEILDQIPGHSSKGKQESHGRDSFTRKADESSKSRATAGTTGGDRGSSAAGSSTAKSGSGRVPSSEEVYRTCAPAIIKIYLLDERNNLVASGSGFLIDDQGTAMTCAHVMEGADRAIAFYHDQSTGSVLQVISSNRKEDWALIQVSNPPRTYLKTCLDYVSGEYIYTLGCPKGQDTTIAEGLISNAKNNVNGTEYIQLSAPISSGSSGGALLNKYGEALGITAASIADGQNLNLAVPIAKVRRTGTPKRLESVADMSSVSSGGYSRVSYSSTNARSTNSGTPSKPVSDPRNRRNKFKVDLD